MAAFDCLITGVSGFVGSHLAELLLDRKYSIAGTFLVEKSLENLSGIADRLEFFQVDLRLKESVKKVIWAAQPKWIFHLAAFSSVGFSFKRPEETLVNNFVSTLNLLEAVREMSVPPKVLLVSSSDIFGQVNKKWLPLKGTEPWAPRSPYAASKGAADLIGQAYFHSFKIPVYHALAFNHTGPRQGPGFAVPDFASQISQIEAGAAKPVLSVGNLKARRDFSDVRDVVRGYELVLKKGKPGEIYTFCSGKDVTIERVLKMLLRLSKVKIKVKSDPARQRPSEIPVLRGDFSKARRELGWKPAIKLEKTLSDTLDYWRGRNHTNEVAV
ncbi:MAG: GDP-mannose 4,6-dehydratase [candidate division Zixibacteria bacterium]|nr:GDP-mannose 4,6-dehydratase [candidate division Zixibacteria bacterium]